MPPVYTVLNARVKQKLATEADWIAAEPDLGVILEGEQAFVYDTNGVPINFKIGDGTKLFSQLPYFIAYYSDVTNLKTSFYLAQNADLTVSGVFRANTDFQKIIFINNSGADISLKVGTTNGGGEIADITLPNGVNQLDLSYYFTTATDVYFTGLTGLDYSLILLYSQLDQAPVTPPSSSSGSFKRFAYGTVYSFRPMYAGHTEACWDLISGLGLAGTDYEGAMLFGVAGLPDIHGYLRTYEDGDTIGGTTGADTVDIARENLPEEGIEMFVNIANNTPNDKPDADDYVAITSNYGGLGYELHKAPTGTPNIGLSAPLGGGNALSIVPLSNIVLRFTGIPTTT